MLWGLGLIVYFLAFWITFRQGRLSSPMDDDVFLPTFPELSPTPEPPSVGGEGIVLKLTSGIRLEYLNQGLQYTAAAQPDGSAQYDWRQNKVSQHDCYCAIPDLVEQEPRKYETDAITRASWPVICRKPNRETGQQGRVPQKLCKERSASSKMLLDVLLDEAMHCTKVLHHEKALHQVHELVFRQSLGACETRQPGFDCVSTLAPILQEEEAECSVANAVPAVSRDLDGAVTALAEVLAREDCLPIVYGGSEQDNSIFDGKVHPNCWVSCP